MILVKHDAEKAKALDTRKTVRKPCPRASIQIEPPAFSTLKRIDRCQQLGSSYNPASQHRMPCDVQSWSDMQKEHIFHKQSLKDLTALPLHACKGMQRAHTTSGSWLPGPSCCITSKLLFKKGSYQAKRQLKRGWSWTVPRDPDFAGCVARGGLLPSASWCSMGCDGLCHGAIDRPVATYLLSKVKTAGSCAGLIATSFLWLHISNHIKIPNLGPGHSRLPGDLPQHSAVKMHIYLTQLHFMRGQMVLIRSFPQFTLLNAKSESCCTPLILTGSLSKFIVKSC